MRVSVGNSSVVVDEGGTRVVDSKALSWREGHTILLAPAGDFGKGNLEIFVGVCSDGHIIGKERCRSVASVGGKGIV